MGAKQGKEAPRFCNTEHSEIDYASSSGHPAPDSSVKGRIRSMKERRNKPGIDKVKADIEASKKHWSELLGEGDKLEEDNLEMFQSLSKQWPSVGGPKFSWESSGFKSVVHAKPFALKSFWNWHHDDLIVDDESFAQGGQAEIFEAVGIDHDEELVLKVFKGGTSLRDLQRQWPHSMLGHESTRSSGYFSGGRYCNGILGATLTKSGRFAFIMAKCWGDLRNLIDLRMEHNNSQGPPFTIDVATKCMWQIAKGMQDLHARDLPHRDLKAPNVLVQKASRYRDFDPTLDNDFKCKLADFECSVGVIGTGFWRAPEILLGLKNRTLPTPNITPSELFTKKSDVYSYAITCYEILTGGMPFEDVPLNKYDGVIDGARPELPSEILPWIKDLLNRCWDPEPNKRPPFEEIVKILEANAGFQLDPTTIAFL